MSVAFAPDTITASLREAAAGRARTTKVRLDRVKAGSASPQADTMNGSPKAQIFGGRTVPQSRDERIRDNALQVTELLQLPDLREEQRAG
jgi:hypothetical protein